MRAEEEDSDSESHSESNSARSEEGSSEIEPEDTDSEVVSSTDSSEYLNLTLPRPNITTRDQADMADLSWDSYTGSPSYNSAEQLPRELPQMFGGNWPPRMLSSECHNQLEVTLLQGGSGDYFEGPVFSSPEAASKSPNIADNGSASTAANIQHISTETWDINPSHTDLETVPAHPPKCAVKGKKRSRSQPPIFSDTETRQRERSSSRLGAKTKIDYSVLNSRGRTQL